MYPIISNIICLMVGAMIGVGCMCLMCAAGKADREMEQMEKTGVKPDSPPEKQEDPDEEG